MGDPTERDWKHMKMIRDSLLNRLCARINAQAKTITDDQDTPEHKKYLVLYKHIQCADDVIARCFNDWRRSSILVRIIAIRRENLFTSEEFEGLSEDLRRTITALEEIQ